MCQQLSLVQQQCNQGEVVKGHWYVYPNLLKVFDKIPSANGKVMHQMIKWAECSMSELSASFTSPLSFIS